MTACENYLVHPLEEILKQETCHFLNYVIVSPWELNVLDAGGFVEFRAASYLR